MRIIYERYKCGMCLDEEVKLEDMVSLSCQPIAHKYCKQCFIEYCSNQIKEAITDIVCPHPSCKTEVTYYELKGNLPADILERYDRFMLRTFCEVNGCVHCPKCNEWFAEIALGDQDEVVWRKIKCQKEDCQHNFCGKCGEPPHKGISPELDISCSALARKKSTDNDIEVNNLEECLFVIT